MDSARAITPNQSDGKANGGGGMVRGKMLSYNAPKQKSGQEATIGINIPPLSVSSTTNKPTSVYPMSVAGSGAAAAVGVGGGVAGNSNNSRRVGGGVISTATPGPQDIAVQGRNSSSSATIGKGALLWTGGSGKNDGSQQQSQSGVNKGDLEPLCDEIPADGVVFARNKSIPGSLVVFRTQEEKLRNPERLNLDRRQLDICPVLKNEQRLRLLNYQNNGIRVIQNLENLPNLIFLDMYNNKLTTLDGPLSILRGLRVLMVGKNRITEITNLSNLRKLDVLDLHSNDIHNISGLEGLTDLRVLNLAGNKIRTVTNLSSLASLTELNLRRNSIERILDLDSIPSLQRIFLSHNLVRTLSDIKCICNLKSLIEFSLDGNPIAETEKYRQSIVSEMPGLKHLDLQKISDEERAIYAAQIATEKKFLRLSRAEVSDPSFDSNVHSALDTTDENTKDLPHLSKFLGLVVSGGVEPSQSSTVLAVGSGKNRFPSSVVRPGELDGLEVNSLSMKSKEGNNVNTSENDFNNDPQSLGTVGLLRMPASLASVQKAAVSAGQNDKYKDKAQISSLHDRDKPEKEMKMNSMDIYESPDDSKKVLHILGDEWEWTHTRRTLGQTQSIFLEKVHVNTIVPKFMAHPGLFPVMNTLKLVNNNIKTLNELKSIAEIFGLTEHLKISNNPVCELSTVLLNNYCIAIFPLLKSINSIPVSDDNRRDAASWFDPICTILNKTQIEASKRTPAQPGLALQNSTLGSMVAATGGAMNGGDANLENGDVLRLNSATGILPVDNKGSNIDPVWIMNSFGSSAVSPSTLKLHADAVTAVIGNLTIQKNQFNELFRKYMVTLIEDSINEVSRQCPAIVTDLSDL